MRRAVFPGGIGRDRGVPLALPPNKREDAGHGQDAMARHRPVRNVAHDFREDAVPLTA